MKSIFELENRLDIEQEFVRLYNVLQRQKDTVLYDDNVYGVREFAKFFEGIDNTVFLEWKYRDTFLNVYEYLDFIGVNDNLTSYNKELYEEIFLYYLEFILNMKLLVDNSNSIELMPIATAAIENIPIILEKMNYKAEKVEDKIIISKRDADIDSVLECVPENISNVLLEYNDFRNKDDIKEKQKLLKAIDLYIENNIKVRLFDVELDNSIGTIVNKMGVNHPIKDEPYKSFTEEQLIEWYDKCFLMMLHAIRTAEINKIKTERKELVSAKT